MIFCDILVIKSFTRNIFGSLWFKICVILSSLCIKLYSHNIHIIFDLVWWNEFYPIPFYESYKTSRFLHHSRLLAAYNMPGLTDLTSCRKLTSLYRRVDYIKYGKKLNVSITMKLLSVTVLKFCFKRNISFLLVGL